MVEGEAIVLGAGEREARRDGRLRRKGKRAIERAGVLLVEKISRRALLLLLLLLRALLPRQPRPKPVVGAVFKFATST